MGYKVRVWGTRLGLGCGCDLIVDIALIYSILFYSILFYSIRSLFAVPPVFASSYRHIVISPYRHIVISSYRHIVISSYCTFACKARCRSSGSTSSTGPVLYVFNRVTWKPRASSPSCTIHTYSLHLSIYCSIYLSIYCSIYLSIYLSIYCSIITQRPRRAGCVFCAILFHVVAPLGAHRGGALE